MSRVWVLIPKYNLAKLGKKQDCCLDVGWMLGFGSRSSSAALVTNWSCKLRVWRIKKKIPDTYNGFSFSCFVLLGFLGKKLKDCSVLSYHCMCLCDGIVGFMVRFFGKRFQKSDAYFNAQNSYIHPHVVMSLKVLSAAKDPDPLWQAYHIFTVKRAEENALKC